MTEMDRYYAKLRRKNIDTHTRIIINRQKTRHRFHFFFHFCVVSLNSTICILHISKRDSEKKKKRSNDQSDICY